MMASYAATKRQVFFKLQMPNSVPYIFTALKVSTPNAVISAIVSEYFAEYIVGVGFWMQGELDSLIIQAADYRQYFLSMYQGFTARVPVEKLDRWQPRLSQMQYQ